MIFDLYLSIDFNFIKSDLLTKVKFKDDIFYKDIRGNEVSLNFNYGYISYLYRGNYSDSYAESIHTKLWQFGYAYTTNEFANSKSKRPWKLTASEILNLYISSPNNFVNNIKGSFVLVFLDEKEPKVQVITDRLNVLPLYYAYEQGKLIISSNISLILKSSWVNKELDVLALAMQHLFDYMLGEYYFLKGIRRFENGQIYSFDKKGLKKYKYWDVSELYHDKLLPKKESLDLLAEQLKSNVNLYASEANKILVSLTGGFDGRTNVAMLERPKDDFICCSYGMPGSKQIRIPQKIAEQLDLNYIPILLDKDFLENYYENTLKASYFSNGTAPIGFCNIPYAYEKLRNYSETIITGLFGSEILRPLHNTGIMLNNYAFDIFLNKNFEIGLKKAIDRISPSSFYEKDFLNQSYTDLLKYLEDNYFNKYKEYSRITQFFFFFIQEGIRKYFSQELSIERVYVTTFFPYFDYDLVNLIYKTPWAGMYNGFLKKSKYKRRKGQLLYAHIFRKYKPELGKIVLDRGYKPDDLLLPFPINYFKIALGVYSAKRYMKKVGGNDTFKTEIWSDQTIDRIIYLSNSYLDELFGFKLKDTKKNGKHLNNFLTYRHMVSMYVYLNLIIQ